MIGQVAYLLLNFTPLVLLSLQLSTLQYFSDPIPSHFSIPPIIRSSLSPSFQNKKGHFSFAEPFGPSNFNKTEPKAQGAENYEVI